MATTFELIKGETLTGSQASYTFSAIPSTFTDLCLKFSIRNDISTYNQALQLTFNSATSSYSETHLFVDFYDPTPYSARNNLAPSAELLGYTTGANGTSNTFASGEMYIPNYAGSTYKPYSSFSVAENNGTRAIVWSEAGLWSSTSAITSITLQNYSSGNLVSGSSFYLYGIKNS